MQGYKAGEAAAIKAVTNLRQDTMDRVKNKLAKVSIFGKRYGAARFSRTAVDRAKGMTWVRESDDVVGQGVQAVSLQTSHLRAIATSSQSPLSDSIF